MISWIVACCQRDKQTLQDDLLASLGDYASAGDELVVVWDAQSMTVAYAEGQKLARNPVRCYVHADVRISDVPRLRLALEAATLGAGMVGVVGSRDVVMPWWEGDRLGSVVDSRMGLLDFGPGGECAMLDGLLLATRQHVDWDVDAPGWHGYDQDACSQMLHKGLWNWCLTGAGEYLTHNAPSRDRSAGYDDAAQRWRERWRP